MSSLSTALWGRGIRHQAFAVPKEVNRTSSVLAEIGTGRSEQSLALPTGRIFAEFQKPTGCFAA